MTGRIAEQHRGDQVAGVVAYQCVLSRRQGKTVARIPAFKLVVSEATEHQALHAAREAVDAALILMLASNVIVPSNDTTTDAGDWISPSAKVQAAVLYRRFRSGRTDAQIARALHTGPPRARELGLGTANITLERLEATAAALGYTTLISYARRNAE